MTSLAEIESAIRETDAATRNLRSATYNLNDKERLVRWEIQRVENQTREASHALSSIDSKIASARSEIDVLHAELSDFQHAREGFESDWRAHENAKRKLRSDITLVLKQSFKLDRQIELSKKRVANYKALRADYTSLEIDISALGNDLVINDLMTRQGDLHGAWLRTFKELVSRSAPEFASVEGLETFQEQYARVVEFRSKIPDAAEIVRVEGSIRAHVRNKTDLIYRLQRGLRRLSGSIGMATYLSTTRDNSLHVRLRDLDTRLRRVRYFLHKAALVIDALSAKRRYLTYQVAVTWVRLLKLRLHKANAGRSALIIREVERALLGPEILQQVHRHLLRSKQGIDKYLQHFFSPHHARIVCILALRFVDDIRANVPHLPLSSAMKIEIDRLTLDYHESFRRRLDIATFQSRSDEQEASKERKRHVRIWSSRGEESESSCAELAEMILQTLRADYEAEAAYLRYRGNCT